MCHLWSDPWAQHMSSRSPVSLDREKVPAWLPDVFASIATVFLAVRNPCNDAGSRGRATAHAVVTSDAMVDIKGVQKAEMSNWARLR